MKKKVALILSLLLIIALTYTPACKKAEEKKAEEAPAPALEEKRAEEEKPSQIEEVTIMGKVSEEGDVVADDGKEYVVADEDMRRELMGLANKKVKVIGTVEESEGKVLIDVTSYEIIEE